MTLQPAPAGAPIEDDDPGTDARGRPAELLGDARAEPDPPVHGRDQVLWINEDRLELDDQEAARLGVPGEDVDDPALAIDREADLRSPDPALDRSEVAHEGFVQVSMCFVRDSIDVAALPAQSDVSPDAECCGYAAEDVEGDATEASALEAADHLSRGTRTARDVCLSQALADSDDAKRVADADVIHTGDDGWSRFTATSLRLWWLGRLHGPASRAQAVRPL